jgi:hypothetical protein
MPYLHRGFVLDTLCELEFEEGLSEYILSTQLNYE